MRTAWAMACVAAGFLVGCGEETASTQAGGEGGQVEGGAKPQAAAGEKLPMLTVADLEKMIADTSGEGRVLVIDFWATWCISCTEIFPALHQGLAELGPGVRSVTVTLDGPKKEQDAIGFLKGHDAMEDAYIILDPAEQEATVRALGQRWNTLVLPAILVFDADGKLAAEFINDVEADPAAIVAKARELMPAGASPVAGVEGGE